MLTTKQLRGPKLIASAEEELNKRLSRLYNRFLILVCIHNEGQHWIDVAMSGNDNQYLARDHYIMSYEAGVNN